MEDNFDPTLLSPSVETEEPTSDEMAALLAADGGSEPPARPTTEATDATIAGKAAVLGAESVEQVPELYKQIRFELNNNNGFSEALARIEQKKKEESVKLSQMMTTKDLIDGIYSESSISPAGVRDGLLQLEEEINSQSLNETFVSDSFFKNSPHTPEGEEVANMSSADYLKQYLLAKQRTQAMVNSWAATNLDSSTSSFWTGTAEAFVPLLEGEQIRRILKHHEEITGEKLDSSTWFGVDLGPAFQAYVASGDGRLALKERMDFLWATDPLEAERVVGEHLPKLSEATGIIHDNDFSAFMRLQELFEGGQGNYNQEDFLGVLPDRVIDNATSILDWVGVGGMIKMARSPVKAAKSGVTLKSDRLSRALGIVTKEDRLREALKAAEQSEIAARTSVDSVAPTSPAGLSEGLNKDRTLMLTEAALKGGDEEALAAFGTTNKGDIAVHAYGPQIKTWDDGVDARVPVESPLDEIDVLERTGNVRRFSEDEVKKLQDEVIKGYELEGRIETRKNMSSFKTEGDTVVVNAVYGPKAGHGFSSITDIVETAAFMLRDRGVTTDNIRILGRKGDKYVPLTKEELAEALVVDKKRKSRKKKTGETAVEPGSKRALFAQGAKIPDDLVPGSMREQFALGPKQPMSSPAIQTKMLQGDVEGIQKLATGPTRGDAQKVLDPETGKMTWNKRKPVLSDFLIEVKMEHKLSHNQLDEMDSPQVVNNMFDRFFARWDGWMTSDWGFGSLQQLLVDAASTFKDKMTFGAASVGTDRAARYEKILFAEAKAWQDTYEKLSKTEKAGLTSYIEKANREGLRFDPIKAKEDGWSQDMISALNGWRTLWDKMWVLENKDLVKSVKARGFMMYNHSGTKTNLVVKPLRKNFISKFRDSRGGIKVYDPETNKSRVLTADEVDELYANTGTIAELRRPLEHDGEVTNLVMAKNDQSSYLRGIQDNEVLLPYREGYYSRRYNDNFFIIEVVKDASGNPLYKRAVGSAKTQKEANILRERLAKADPDGAEKEMFVERDKRDKTSEEWKEDLHEAGGRSAQKVRGQALQGWFSDEKLGLAEIENPMESLVNSIKSISYRTSMRDWFETSKARLVKNFSDYMPPDEYGRPRYPVNAQEIFYRGNGMGDDWKLADARTVYNYIRGMEDGYTNLVDGWYKHFVGFAADMFGSRGWTGLEKFAFMTRDAKGPVAAAKSFVSTAVLFSAPLRQIVVQGAQALQTLGVIRPGYLKHYPYQVHALLLEYNGMSKYIPDKVLKRAGLSRDELKKMVLDFRQSGLADAIDKQNLVRGVLMDMADRAAASKFRKAVTSPLHLARRVGMDAGEFINTLSTYAVFYDKAKHAGKAMDDVMTLQDVSVQTRSFSGSMNAAGDMPYNHNLLSIPMQFAQIGHKMLMNMTFNQHLTKTEKIRLAATNLLMFGIPAQAVLEEGLGQYLPEDQNLRNVILEGVNGFFFNTLMGAAFDTDTRLDISASLSPFNTSLVTTITSLLTSDIITTLDKSPVGSMFFGHNPKVQRFFLELRDYMVPREGMPPAEMKTVLIAGAEIFSGMSHAFKAYQVANFNRTISMTGKTQDFDADALHAVGAAFGFSTIDEMQMRAFQNIQYETREAMKKDIKEVHKQFMWRIKLHGQTGEDLKTIQQAMALGVAAFGYTPAFWEEWEKLTMAAAKNNEFNGLVETYNSLGIGDIDHTIELMRLQPEYPGKQEAIDALIKLKESGQLYQQEDE